MVKHLFRYLHETTSYELQFWRDWSSGPVTVGSPFRESRRERVEWEGRFVCPKQTAGVVVRKGTITVLVALKKRDGLKLSFLYQLECPLGSSGLQLAMGKEEVVNVSHDFLKDQLGRTPTTPPRVLRPVKMSADKGEKTGNFFGL
ncbi:hypothetical protein CDAR_296381 [Caerostris darwini]|uniref:Uncharacterized protein n=1 Tax=Caerostris darwini TaxID=1538125 RepID=A0AAV4PKD6_9ARAC|nr:hypothetical protein CDAR_296381 [Caerostris darwini]